MTGQLTKLLAGPLLVSPSQTTQIRCRADESSDGLALYRQLWVQLGASFVDSDC